MLVFTTKLEKDNYIKSNKTDELLLTIKEFEEEVVSLKDEFNFIDEEVKRVMFLKKATEFKEFKSIDLSHQDFFLFINDLKTMLRFYQELNVENIQIEDIIEYVKEHNIYLNYEKHLNILLQTLNNYKKLLNEHKYVDMINIREHSQINKEYVESFDRIIIHYTGYITEYDFSLFSNISKYTKLKLSINISEYDKKNTDRLNYYFDTTFEEAGHYLLDFTEKKFKKYDISLKDISINLHKSTTQMEEVLFLIETLKVLEEKNESNIGIVVNDETIINLIELDNNNNYNFIRKKDFSTHSVFKYLKKIFYILKNIEFEDINEELKKKNTLFLTRIINQGIISKKDLNYLTKNHKEKNFDHVNIISVLKNVLYPNVSEKIKSKLEERFRRIEKNKEYKEFSFMEQLWFMLDEIKTINLSTSISGYPIYNLLETRFLKFKHLIILDFNEQEIPMRSKKDLFLNSNVREDMGIPTYKDRANLQKHYYFELFNNSENIIISYLDNEESDKSKFLLSFDCKLINLDNTETIKNIFNNEKRLNYKNYNDEIILEDCNLGENKLSSTKLKSYLTCKRQFFYKYIEKIKEPELLLDIEKGNEFGILFHNILNEIYKTYQKEWFSEENLYKEIKKRMISAETNENIFYKFKNDLWDLKIKKFVKFEIERIETGIDFVDSEVALETEYRGITLYGQIDRIDKFNDSYVVLDYKTGNFSLYTERTVENASDFQLEFYHLLVENNLGKVGFAGYYDLKNVDIVSERLLDKKMEILDKKIDEFKEPTQNFELTTNKNDCFYCPYKEICAID